MLHDCHSRMAAKNNTPMPLSAAVRLILTLLLLLVMQVDTVIQRKLIEEAANEQAAAKKGVSTHSTTVFTIAVQKAELKLRLRGRLEHLAVSQTNLAASFTHP